MNKKETMLLVLAGGAAVFWWYRNNNFLLKSSDMLDYGGGFSVDPTQPLKDANHTPLGALILYTT